MKRTNKMELVEKYYFVNISQFQDKENRPRQKLDIIPELVYKTSQNIRDDQNLHLIWYSNPDPKKYNLWDLNQLIIGGIHLEILNETALISEIASMSNNIQPHDFEQILQRLGFHQK